MYIMKVSYDTWSVHLALSTKVFTWLLPIAWMQTWVKVSGSRDERNLIYTPSLIVEKEGE